MHLSRFPRIRIGHMNTPLEPMPRLSAALGGPNLWIKRDDCTGLATGGNKTRKLEFLIADALEQGADIVITQGATQSNHARQTAAAAAKTGLECLILLEDRTAYTDEAYTRSGNVLLDHILGAPTRTYPGATDMAAAMEEVADELRAKGRKPYVTPGGGSNAIGALGYVNCAIELTAQANDMGLRIDHLVHATGSAGTQAGLVAGSKACAAASRCSASACARPRTARKTASTSWPPRRPSIWASPARSAATASGPIATMSAKATACRPTA